MATKKEREQEQQEALEWLKKIWVEKLIDPSSVVVFSTEYGKGSTDYVSVTLYYQDGGKGQVFRMTGVVGKALGRKFRRSESRIQIAMGGYGYSKSYQVAYDLFRLLDIPADRVNYEYR